MSIVVAVKKPTGSAIAADTLGTHHDLRISSQNRVNHHKICTYGESFVGLVGDSAIRCVFNNIYRLHPKRLKFGNSAEIFDTFLALHKVLKSRYYINTAEDDTSNFFEPSPICALILNTHGLFHVMCDRNVSEYSRYFAIGAGYELALGAMHALYERCDDPAVIARAGVEAACEYSAHCGLPIDCRLVGKPNKAKHKKGN